MKTALLMLSLVLLASLGSGAAAASAAPAAGRTCGMGGSNSFVDTECEWGGSQGHHCTIWTETVPHNNDPNDWGTCWVWV